MTNWLIGKSAYTRLAVSPDATTWPERIERGLVRIGTVTRLEIGYSFRTGPAAREETASAPLVLMPVEHLTPATEDRAPAVPDLLVAAAAELAELTVLTRDEDFHLIAQITGQSVERLRL